ncbi:Ig-like domain-containing protein [Sphingomonas swuensis]|uniref:Ig-like domain-containing protein n=1 Tax=Sphingomonas swuensis TaxID=977800 RepID=UPI0031D4CBA2
MSEGANLSGNALSNDSGVSSITKVRFGSGADVTVTSAGTTIQGTYGQLTIYSNGSYTYTATSLRAEQLAAGAVVNDYFTYTATGSGGTGTNDIKVTVTGTNDAPVLTATSVSLTAITEDQTNNAGQTVASFLTSSDIDTGALKGIAITQASQASGGWQYSLDGGTSWVDFGTLAAGSGLLLRSTDRVRFQPDTIDGTTAGFTFRAWDQSSGSAGQKVAIGATGGDSAFSAASGQATLAVTAINDVPVAQNGSAQGEKDGPPITGVLSASDVDGPALTYQLVADSAVGGTVTIDPANGGYVFTPEAGFSGFASFQFLASDGTASSAPATVTIQILSDENSVPVANDDEASVYPGNPVLIDVLANDSDADSDALVITGVGDAAHGTVAIQSGKILYTPAAGYEGSDAFTYSIADGAGGVAQGNVSVTVAAPAGTPSAVTVTFRQGGGGYTGTVDTVLRESRATTSYPDAVTLHGALETGKSFQPLLRFDSLFGTGPGQIPIGATIVSATLRLEVTEGSASGGTLNPMLVGWSGTSTWSSLGSGVQVNGVEASTANVVTVGAVGLGSRAFDVTASLAAWSMAGSTAGAANAANLGWLIKAAGLDGWDFTSSEGAIKPVLSVTYTQVAASASSLPIVSITSSSAVENAGKIGFTLTLSQASTKSVDVGWTTVDHTAKAGADFTAALQSLTFAPGETSKTIEVLIGNDSAGERAESFFVQLLSATNARIDAPVASGRIVDDDAGTIPFTPISASVVAVHNLADGSKYRDGGTGAYGIGDPSGLAYIPGMDTLLIGDSEHDETPYNSPTNLFSVRPDGSYAGNYSLTSYTKEPTGLAYNSANGFLYIADDDKAGVFWTSPSNPAVKLGFFDTGRLGFLDTEDLKFDPMTGHLYILDGLMKQIVELTDTGQFVDSIKLPSVMTDAEALAYDPVHDVFFVGSGASANIWVLDHQGQVLQTLTTLSAYSARPKLKGFELAPSSDPNDGDALSLYVLDYGSDQQNDGRLFEVHLGGYWLA